MPAQTTGHAASSSPHPQRCEYTSKRCENARALKPNGERHRLCDYHRRLANDNQRRWQNRKKLLQQRHDHDHDQSSPRARSGPVPLPLTSERLGLSYYDDHDDQETLPLPRYSPSFTQPPAPTLRGGDEPLVLPRLRQHHVLSHALSLPVTQPHQSVGLAVDGLEFGGVPRGTTGGLPPLRETHRPIEYERSSSEPPYFDDGAWAPPHSDYARSVPNRDF